MTIAAARAHLPVQRAGGVIALLSVTTALGAGIGYPITTAVVQAFGTPAAYAGAAGLVVGAALGLRLGVPGVGAAARIRSTPDVVGALVMSVAVGAGLLGLSHGNALGWLHPAVLVPLGLAPLLLVSWVWWEGRVAAPLVRLDLLRLPAVVQANVGALLMGYSLYSLPVLVVRAGLLPLEAAHRHGLTLA
ncbi:hypothetical protein [Pseudonocardia sp. NPDC049154]|uniref:hypothetical protein n=1 Tax=Pseudonocardia sp. NPDC049154 TaxID=3155501 RepID=UPI0033FC0929